MAITATFTPSSQLLTMFGDNLNNTITFTRNAAGTILVNGGAVAIKGGTPTVANTALIQVFGQGGNDVITLDEANGALPARQPVRRRRQRHASPAARAATCCSARAGNDTLLGKGGNRLPVRRQRERHADRRRRRRPDVRRVRRRPHDLEPGRRHRPASKAAPATTPPRSTAATAPRSFTVTANGTRVRFDRLDPAPFSIDIGTTENLVLNMNGGDDSFSATGNLAALIKHHRRRRRRQRHHPRQQRQRHAARRRRQRLHRRPAGQRRRVPRRRQRRVPVGSGRRQRHGRRPGRHRHACCSTAAPANEIFEAVGERRARCCFTRNLGNIVMDLNDVETVTLNALGGTDTVIVNDLTGTDVTKVNVNLAGTIGGTAGDAAADTVIVNATNGNDIIDVFGAGHVRVGPRPGRAGEHHGERRRERLARHQRARRQRQHHRHDPAGRRDQADASTAAPATTRSSAARAPTR